MDKVETENLKQYDLRDGYSIENANWKDFSLYFAVYIVCKSNIWFRQSFDFYRSVLEDCNECYWIKRDVCRIGGVTLEPNYINCLYLEPPYNEYDIVISKLKNWCLSQCGEGKAIYAGVQPEDAKYYQRNGFMFSESSRCMIRPTEEFNIAWSDEYEVVTPNKEDKDIVSKLFVEVFNKFDTEGYTYYFNNFIENNKVNTASTLIYDKNTHELIGACLISIWEEWPLIFDIGVKKPYQRRGLASNMIKRALSVLKEEYPVLRLFVTIGNNAEMTYHKLGFLPGQEKIEMILKA